MTQCEECECLECGWHYADNDEHEEFPICNECGAECSRRFFNEDYGSES